MQRSSLLAGIGCFLFLTAFPGPCTTFDDARLPDQAPVDGGHDGPPDAGADSGPEPEPQPPQPSPDAGPGIEPDGGQDGGESDVELGQAAAICARAFACPGLPEAMLASIGFPLDARNYPLCLHWVLGPTRPEPAKSRALRIELFECIAEAADCEQALGCAFVRPLTLDDPLCEGEPEGPRCDPSAEAVIECPGWWRRCNSPLYANIARCHQGTDLLGAPVARCLIQEQCTAADDVRFCNESLAVNCDVELGYISVTDCSITGRSCLAQQTGAVCLSAAGNLTCVFQAFPGTYASEVLRAGSSTCIADTDVAAVCDGDKFSTFDCSAAGGQRCVNKDYPPWAWCAPADAECYPDTIGEQAAACDGDRLTACLKGRPVVVDCAEYGMQCQPGSPTRSAYCTLALGRLD